ncbi:MAG TPA: SDR family NAD(P)-dependent oxidoreductase, partial [Pseudonocardiaceae bacterium]|nr:SDR family NAD(P)-dependent oxidoreductase [Pseudonocardiaceae bacterium]
IARRSGRILNIGSGAGFLPGPYMATYYASKAFVVSFTDALSYELRGTGVTATVLCPGPTETEFAQVASASKALMFKTAADAASVARYGYRAMLAGKAVAVPGISMKLSLQSLRASPRSVMRVIAGRMNRPA